MENWVALITDQHFGARNFSQDFHNFFMKFYDDVFFPTIKERNIKHIIDLGDTFDKRKQIDFNILSQVKLGYYDKLQDMGISILTLVGNHTAYYKNTNNINTPSLLLSEYKNVTVIDTPSIHTLYGHDLLMLPWLNRENDDIAFDLLNEHYRYGFGHLEINGFEMYEGILCMDSHYDVYQFSNVEQLFSGHFHHRSSRGNLQYLGNPYEITWHDYNDLRGFHLLELNSGKVEFIKNPFKMFHKIFYDFESPECQAQFNDLDMFSGTHVKLVVRNRGLRENFESDIEKLFSVNPLSVVLIDDIVNDGMVVTDVDDTVDICRQNVEQYAKLHHLKFPEEIEYKLLSLLERAELERDDV